MKDAAWWAEEVKRSHNSWQTYRTRARDVIKRYQSEREDEMYKADRAEFNILFSNTQTLRPAVYSKKPNPDIRRRFAQKDPLSRVTADILQRAVSYCNDVYDFHGELVAVNDDYTLPGFGVARIVYRPFMKQRPAEKLEAVEEGTIDPTVEQEADAAVADGEATVTEEKVYEEVRVEHVEWDRFAMSRSPQWRKVWWVAFAEDLTQDEVKAAFGAEIAASLQYSHKETIQGFDGTQQDDSRNTARVWEVWDKRSRKRFAVADGFDKFLLPPEDDPLKLEGFFPCPKPLWAIRKNNNLVPQPEFLVYRDQAIELDRITQRLQVLIEALKRRGVYDGANKDVLAQIANASQDNLFVPVEQWQALMEKGGLQNIIAEMPIEGIAKVVLQLYDYRDRCKAIIYEVTGMSDIIRGASIATETAAAQQIKAQFASLRISDRKDRFAEFARDLIRMKAEVIAERFDAGTLQMISGIELFETNEQKMQAQQALGAAQQGQQIPGLTPEVAEMAKKPTWEDVIGLLRNQKLRAFKIDIETDSTVMGDAQIEQKNRTEFLGAVAAFIQQAGQAVQAGAMSKDAAKALLGFGVRAFRVGSEVEDALDEIGDQPQQDPRMAQMQQEMQKKEAEIQQREMQIKDAEHAAEMAAKDAQIQRERMLRQETELKYREELLAIKEQIAGQLIPQEA